jgi:hypothetical protein
VIFVCGPFGRRPLLEELVERFRGLSFAAPLQPALPVTAVLLAQPQAEYGGGLHGAAAEAIARLPDLRPTAPFHTDTDLIDADRIRGAGEATSLIARADDAPARHGPVPAPGRPDGCHRRHPRRGQG